MSDNNHQAADNELSDRLSHTQDSQRSTQVEKRHAKGFNTARENLNKLCDGADFSEYGQLSVAAQRGRKNYTQLQTDTAADGVITGVAEINRKHIDADDYATALIINDYSVLAGTQGYFHHAKLDRIIEIADKRKLPVIMLTEGGGGRPGDTDINTVISGLQCTTFSRWAGLAGIVPRITVNNGYCFAGNAALFGAGDIRIATQSACIGMAGPAMIEGGGLGQFDPTEIGPIAEQAANGVVDIVAKDENHAIEISQYCLGFFQGRSQHVQAPAHPALDKILPADRRFTYDMHKVIQALVDQNSFIELGNKYGQAITLGFARLNGHAVAIIANNCKVLGGAIDVDAAKKLARFMRMCDQFGIPLLSLVDTPGFMVGPAHEKLGAVSELSHLFTVGAKLSVPLIAVVLRKCYGLGAQAMLGGSTSNPSYTLSWPTGEFGPMGLEGAVKLGFKNELNAIEDEAERKAMFDKLVAQQYAKGKAIEVATVLELDAVIHAKDTRKVLLNAFGFQ